VSKRTYSPTTLKALWALSGNTCAYPGCSKLLVQGATTGDRLLIIGEMAHIFGASERGPRGKENASELHDFENLILLCPTHHTLVDKDAEEYTPEKLRRWKKNHEQAVLKAAIGPTGQPRICERLNGLLAASVPGGRQQESLELVFRSRRLESEWRYSFDAGATCSELAAALAEQHFSPFADAFTWHLCHSRGNLLPPEATLSGCGLKHGDEIGLKMTCTLRALDPAARGHPLMYYHHELGCSGDLLTYISKFEAYIGQHVPEARELNNLAWMYLEANVDLHRAEQLLDQCTRLDPAQQDSPAVIDSTGWLHWRTANPRSAEPLLCIALNALSAEEGEAYYTVLYHLYFTWLSLGKEDLAATARKRILQWTSTWGIDMLMRKRVAENSDTLLIPRGCRYGDSVWLEFFGLNREGSDWTLDCLC
jgi:hypothetical protein